MANREWRIEVSLSVIRYYSPVSSLNLPCLFRQHNRDAVADRISQFGRTRDQLLLGGIKLQPARGQRTDQDFQQFGIDGAFEAFGRSGHAVVSGSGMVAVAYPIEAGSVVSRFLVRRVFLTRTGFHFA